MRAKAEILREAIRGLRVLDVGVLGGAEYARSNKDYLRYTSALEEAWKGAASRTIVDIRPAADIIVDFNAEPIPTITGVYDIAVIMDVLEHIERPIDVMRWVPCNKALVSLPNAESPLLRYCESRFGWDHLYSFTRYSGRLMLESAGWKVDSIESQIGQWCIVGKILSRLFTAFPAVIGMTNFFTCSRIN